MTNRTIAFHEYKLKGYIYDTTRKKIEQIHALYNGRSVYEYCIMFSDASTTHFLTIEQLRELYPFIGTNLKSIQVLYG